MSKPNNEPAVDEKTKAQEERPKIVLPPQKQLRGRNLSPQMQAAIASALTLVGILHQS